VNEHKRARLAASPAPQWPLREWLRRVDRESAVGPAVDVRADAPIVAWRAYWASEAGTLLSPYAWHLTRSPVVSSDVGATGPRPGRGLHAFKTASDVANIVVNVSPMTDEARAAWDLSGVVATVELSGRVRSYYELFWDVDCWVAEVAVARRIFAHDVAARRLAPFLDENEVEFTIVPARAKRPDFADLVAAAVTEEANTHA
jgi:hypothetical protein